MPELAPKQKRKARIIALQIIYAKELKGSKLNDTCTFLSDSANSYSSDVLAYGKKLSNKIFTYTVEADKLIKSRSKNWDFNRITIIDKLILRMSLVEMLYIDDIPPKVSISEGVEIAKEFSTDDSSSFINGILDSVYNEMIKNNQKIV